MITETPLYTRPALLESIATASALASTAKDTAEYSRWANRETELKMMAGILGAAEVVTIERTMQQKVATYGGFKIDHFPLAFRTK